MCVDSQEVTVDTFLNTLPTETTLFKLGNQYLSPAGVCTYIYLILQCIITL